MAATLETEYIVVITLCSVLVVLVLVILSGLLFVLKRRRMFCFKGDAAARPFSIPDRRIEAGMQVTQETKPRRPFSNAKPSRQKKGKPRYKPLERSPSMVRKDPFANSTLENPIVDPEELDEEDWTNPAFDRERASHFDAAVAIQTWFRTKRDRTRYLQLKEATVFLQALCRGWRARRSLPQLRREKQLRDHQRRRLLWKKKGTLSALKFYEVKGYGFAEVEQLYGLETTRHAADQLKKLYGGKGKMRLKLFISVKGIKLFEYYGMGHFATVKVSSVSFCTLDPRNKRIFAFINRKKKRNFCHVFQASEQDAQRMVETMAEAFEVTFRKLEEKREQQLKQKIQMEKESKLARLRKQAFHRQSQELQVELESMLEMAESASLGSGASNTHLVRPELGTTGTSDGQESPLTGSREKLLQDRHYSHSGTGARESGLLKAQRSRASSTPSRPVHNPPRLNQPLERSLIDE